MSAAPLIVVEGPSAAFADVLADVADAGWTLREGWTLPERPAPHAVSHGSVTSAREVRAVMLAAVAGFGIVAHARAARHETDELCEDLRHLGRLDHRIVSDDEPMAALSGEERRILALMADGATIASAAIRLHLARRSADRRLARARAALGARSTEAAIVAYRARLDRIGRPPGIAP